MSRSSALRFPLPNWAMNSLQIYNLFLSWQLSTDKIDNKYDKETKIIFNPNLEYQREAVYFAI